MLYKLIHTVDAFLPISLENMDRVKLMNRMDTKFIGSANDLENLLVHLFRDYYVLEINNERILPYHTVYYDTRDFQLYRMHHNGKLHRTKIRFREYEISNLGFLEVKNKNNKKRTDKKRIESKYNGNGFEKNHKEFILEMTSLDTNKLEEKLYNHFDRITLVGKERDERLTIDMNLRFESPDGKITNLIDLVILELKQDINAEWSPLKQILKASNFNAHSFSKYCIGCVLLYPNLKYNRFKSHLLMLEKICSNQIIKENYEQYTGNIQLNIAV